MKKIKMAKSAYEVGGKLPLFDPTYYCPNANCECEKKLKKGEKCPRCGKEAKSFGMMDGAALFATKKAVKKNATKKSVNKKAKEREKAAEKGRKVSYYCPNPACTNIKELRQGEKCPACGIEAQLD
jgi:hypothetical protein